MINRYQYVEDYIEVYLQKNIKIKIDVEDLEKVCLPNIRWRYVKRGASHSNYVSGYINGQAVINNIASLILDTKKGERIFYFSDDRCDLRKSNLSLVPFKEEKEVS